ncbi:lipase family alpha/beta hydrolase [Nocardioides sp. NPDC101246]|uniref:lipase family alpha/beta hydrolase n=1 Tax=Nocardioides sp. NPDC101246 TaxID=3364336 RepID=UPI00382359A1
MRTPKSVLAAALHCSGGLRNARHEPVLLVAGTGATPHEQYSWNYEPALTARHVPWCTVTMPDHTLGDIQVAAEYIVFAVRRMHRVAGRRIAIVGHSQGGVIPRWALKFWPDVRGRVADMIGLAPANHGTKIIRDLGTCSAECVPAAWQLRPGSRFLRALNHPVETHSGSSYSQIYTRYDELSTPAGARGTSPLRTGQGQIANIALQQVCPVNPADHVLIGSTDPVGFALVMDAITHRGPARASRVSSTTCAQLVIPGLDPIAAPHVLTAFPYLVSGASPFNLVGAHKSRTEPPLRAYAR